MNHSSRFDALRSELWLALPILVLTLALPALADDPHLRMGNPSGATADESNRNNYLMEKPYFALAFNDKTGTPNWVSWRLSADDLGSAPRAQFYPDETLPTGFKQVTPKDYTRSGFDRGHMCPHSDRTANDEMSRATFVMTNIAPQSPNLNQKAWDQLERYARELVKQGKTLYIVSGPYGSGGTGKDGYMTVIGKDNNVVVPSKCWKVIMVLAGGREDDLQKVNSATRTIAVIMPNDMSVGDEWAGFRVSVADVEKLTGYKFFNKVSRQTGGDAPSPTASRYYDRTVPSAPVAWKQRVDTEEIPPPVPYPHEEDED